MDTVGNANDYNIEVSGNTFSSEIVHETPIPFFVQIPELGNDVNRHLQEDFINNFNCVIETAETKLMENISYLTKYYAIKYLTKSKKHAPLQFLKVKLKNGFQRVALVDFAKHMWDKWVLYN